MSALIHKLIQEKFNEEECPLFDGIVFGTGAIVIMECRLLVIDEKTEFCVHPIARAPLQSFLNYNPEGWASISTLATSHWERQGVILTFGEGCHGSYGFVAVSNIASERLQWLAFFQRSNPFLEARIEGSEVVAISNLEHTWRFPIDQPELVRVEGVAGTRQRG